MSESDSKQPRHGRVTNPESRGSYAIKKGLLLEWEVVAMEGGKNFPDLEPGLAHDFPGVDEPKFDPASAAKPPADGFILSGGQTDNRRFVNLTDNGIVEEIKKQNPGQQDEAWPRLSVKRGEEFKVTWFYAAKHLTRGYRWFITKDGWDETTPITREDFKGKNYVADKHFKIDSQDGLMWSDISDLAPADQYHTELQPKDITSATLPSDKSGHHVILLAWIIAETDKAFYQAFDVEFDASESEE
ncbi:Chitin-binding protein [Pseudomonas savastanoi pv. fraxini]|uniref:Chitin-binding protein n=2 Tax=Pseudomonas TaxID=286 RepID=A0AB74BHI5_PSESS|nr:Chitin-binding protein [Pseudomonas savastanoi pv. retacarpa]KUG43530.1 Chitin-binding protein [Pseudomonas savastanoi pv. fraxini]RML76840.1 Chitin-binding protein [Pseudomonas savastanoi pv. savastanoi]RMM02184.1 Chitin-binding protein [Pseudomonas savastanoi]RMT75455.1 Chitin-binding protein [Pseudomonas savastanoi pv. nerii]